MINQFFKVIPGFSQLRPRLKNLFILFESNNQIILHMQTGNTVNRNQYINRKDISLNEMVQRPKTTIFFLKIRFAIQK